MSVGATMSSTGISVRSPANAGSNHTNLEDVELGSSSHGHQRRIKAKDSDLEMTALISSSGNGESKSLMSPRAGGASGGGGEGESSSLMKSLIASAMYSGCSVGMVLVNKSLASRCGCVVLSSDVHLVTIAIDYWNHSLNLDISITHCPQL